MQRNQQLESAGLQPQQRFKAKLCAFLKVLAAVMSFIALVSLYGTMPRPWREPVDGGSVGEQGRQGEWLDEMPASAIESRVEAERPLVPEPVVAPPVAVPAPAKRDADGEMERILDAIRVVENRPGNPHAVGDRGLFHKAYGLYQIRQPYLDDVNTIAGRRGVMAAWGKPSLTLWDIRDGRKARWAVKTYLRHYGRAYRRETGREPSAKVYAAIHNGGPSGWKMKWRTRLYLAKVMRVLSSLEERG